MRVSLAAMGLFFIVLFVVGWIGHRSSRGHLEALAQQANVGMPVVTTTTPHGAIESDMVLPGSIQAIEETVIGSRTTGYLRRRYVDIGSRVKAGDLLAEIESPEVDQQVLQARADTVRSQAGAAQAQAEATSTTRSCETRRSALSRRATSPLSSRSRRPS